VPTFRIRNSICPLSWRGESVAYGRVPFGRFSNMDVYSNGGRADVFVRMLCRDYDPVRHFELYAFGSEPMLAFASVQVFGHARDHGKARELCDE
jgi:hypothetical protein